MSGALKEGAGCPGFAVAADGTAVACSPRSCRSRRVRQRPGFCSGRAWGPPVVSGSTLADRVEHTRRGQDLRQHDGLAPSAGVEQIERNAAAAELLQKLGDFRVLARPVTLEGDDAALGEGLADGTLSRATRSLIRQVTHQEAVRLTKTGLPAVSRAASRCGVKGSYCNPSRRAADLAGTAPRQGSGEKDAAAPPAAASPVPSHHPRGAANRVCP